jgi:hypothetical protein
MFRSSIYRLTRTERRSIVLIVPGLLWFGPLCTVFFLGTLSLTRSVSPLECDGPVNVVRRTPHCDGGLFLGRLAFFRRPVSLDDPSLRFWEPELTGSWTVHKQ